MNVCCWMFKNCIYHLLINYAYPRELQRLSLGVRTAMNSQRGSMKKLYFNSMENEVKEEEEEGKRKRHKWIMIWIAPLLTCCLRGRCIDLKVLWQFVHCSVVRQPENWLVRNFDLTLNLLIHWLGISIFWIVQCSVSNNFNNFFEPAC